MKTNTLAFTVFGLLYLRGALCLTASDIVNKANSYIGSTKWALDKFYSIRFRSGSYKCNLFIHDVLKAVGADLPSRHWYIYSPISATEWGDQHSSFLTGEVCWNACTGGRHIGDVISDRKHVGFVTDYQMTTSATASKVIQNNWGFRSSGESGASDSITACWRYDYNSC